MPGVGAHTHVLQRGHPPHSRTFWNVRAMPLRVILCCLSFAPVAHHRRSPCHGWGVDTGDGVETGGLTRPVRTDQAEDPPRRISNDIAQRREPAGTRRSGHAPAARCRPRRWRCRVAVATGWQPTRDRRASGRPPPGRRPSWLPGRRGRAICRSAPVIRGFLCRAVGNRHGFRVCQTACRGWAGVRGPDRGRAVCRRDLLLSWMVNRVRV